MVIILIYFIVSWLETKRAKFALLSNNENTSKSTDRTRKYRKQMDAAHTYQNQLNTRAFFTKGDWRCMLRLKITKQTRELQMKLLNALTLYHTIVIMYNLCMMFLTLPANKDHFHFIYHLLPILSSLPILAFIDGTVTFYIVPYN